MSLNKRGFTLPELMIVGFIGGLLALAFANFFSKAGPAIKRTQVRQEVTMGGRKLMATILQTLRGAKPRSVVIRTFAGSTCPNSQIDFQLHAALPSGITAYQIYLDNGTVYMRESRGGTHLIPKPIGSHVTFLNFTGDYRDPTTLSVSLRIDAPYDSSNNPTHVTSMSLLNQTVRLLEAP